MKHKMINLIWIQLLLFCFLQTALAQNANTKSKSATISFTFKEKFKDTILLTFSPNNQPYEVRKKQILIPINNKKSVSYKVDFVNNPMTFRAVLKGKLDHVPAYYISQGQHANFVITKTPDRYNKYTSTPAGSLAKQYLCFQKLERLFDGEGIVRLGPDGFDQDMPKGVFEQAGYIVNKGKRTLNAQLDELERNKSFLPLEIFHLVKSDLIGKYARGIELNYFYKKKGNNAKNESWRKLVNEATYEKDKYPVSAYTQGYLDGCFSLLQAKYRTEGLNPLDIGTMLQGIEENYSGVMRDKMYTYYLMLRSPMNDLESYKSHALKTVSKMSNSVDRKALIGHLSKIESGASFFPFVLTASDGRKISLADFKGKILFMDIWFTGCSGCIQAAKVIEEGVIPHFKNNKNILFASVSTDIDKNQWLRSVQEGIYTAPESLNLYTNGEGWSHPLIQYYNLNGAPVLMLVDKEGKTISTKMPRTAPEIIKIIESALQAPVDIKTIKKTEADKQVDELTMIFQNDDSLSLKKMIGNDANKCYGEYSLLSHSIRYNAKRCFELLLSKNSNVNLICDGYLPPIMHAAKYGRLAMVRVLVAKGAILNYKYEGTYQPAVGETPYSYAVKYGKTEVAEYLKSQTKN